MATANGSSDWYPMKPVNGATNAPVRNPSPPCNDEAAPAERRPASCASAVVAGSVNPVPASTTQNNTHGNASGASGTSTAVASNPTAPHVEVVIPIVRNRPGPVRATHARKMALAAAMAAAFVAKITEYVVELTPNAVRSTNTEPPM